jgi:hypothetical protein
MRKEICKICNSESDLIFNKSVLGKYPADYFYCKNCGFLQTERPYWLEEAYRSVINDLDTGLLQRNIYYSKITSVILFYYFRKNAEFLDYGGGYGIFTRLMRDNGFNFFVSDPNCPNLFAKEFQFNPKINRISLITSWECFEHFENPLEDLEKMLEISKNIMFSTELLPDHIPIPEEWGYYGFDHGQHISFYSKKTFLFLSKKFGLNYYSAGNLHLLTEKKLSSASLFLLKAFSLHGGDYIINILRNRKA